MILLSIESWQDYSNNKLNRFTLLLATLHFFVTIQYYFIYPLLDFIFQLRIRVDSLRAVGSTLRPGGLRAGREPEAEVEMIAEGNRG